MRAFHLLRASCLVFVLAARAVSSAQISAPLFPDVPYYVGGSCTPMACDPQSTQCLDVYVPSAPLPGEPTVLFIHGGGWGSGNKRGANEAEFCSRLKDLGYAVVSINYTLACAGPSFPQAVKDVRAALAWIRGPGAKAPYDLSSCVVAVGTSAGGHLAAMLGVLGDNTDPFFVPVGAHNLKFAPQAVIPISGAFDFHRFGVDGGGTTPAGCCGPVTFPSGYPSSPYSILVEGTQDFLGCPWTVCGGLPCTPTTPKWNDSCYGRNTLTGYLFLDGSPIHWVTPADPPFCFLQSLCDRVIPAVETDWMIDALAVR